MIDRIILILGFFILAILVTLGLLDYEYIYDPIINITSIVAFLLTIYQFLRNR